MSTESEHGMQAANDVIMVTPKEQNVLKLISVCCLQENHDQKNLYATLTSLYTFLQKMWQ